MSIERDRCDGGVITFECDECGEEEPTETPDFQEALQHIKDSGWRIKKEGANWLHLCPACR